MNEASPSTASGTGTRNLAEVVRQTKNAAADREDVVVDLREAGRMRLDLLLRELEPVFADVPDDEPGFDFAISSGEQPRLWIDAVAHVAMARDRRTYRFVRDTRIGRVVLAESSDVTPVADQVTRYIAERLVERQRRIEGEVNLPASHADTVAPTVKRAGRNAWREFALGALLVVFGAIVGAAAVVFFTRERFPEVMGFLRRLIEGG